MVFGEAVCIEEGELLPSSDVSLGPCHHPALRPQVLECVAGGETFPYMHL